MLLFILAGELTPTGFAFPQKFAKLNLFPARRTFVRETAVTSGFQKEATEAQRGEVCFLGSHNWTEVQKASIWGGAGGGGDWSRVLYSRSHHRQVAAKNIDPCWLQTPGEVDEMPHARCVF